MCVLVPFQQHEEDILLGAEVLHRGRPGANLPPQDVVEDLSHIFLTLEATDKADMYEGNGIQNTQNSKAGYKNTITNNVNKNQSNVCTI